MFYQSVVASVLVLFYAVVWVGEAVSARGMLDDSTGCLVAYHANIESLLSHITILGMPLQAEQEQFEVAGVTVNASGRSAMQQHVNGNCSGVSVVDATVTEHDHRGVSPPVLMGDPCKTQSIRGDGNCFFRALAFAVSGSETDHRKIRRAVTIHMEKNESRKILNGKMPEESVGNNLTLDPIPPALQNLNSLEQHLIGMNIPFMRLMSLPKGGQNGVHGPVVCVPSNITDVTETLPRSENVDLMIPIKLKRKLTYKGHYEYKFVNSDKIKNALLYLKEHNPFYRDVQFNSDWVNPLSKIEEETIEQDDTSMQNGDEENTEENNEAEAVNIDETLHDRQQRGMFMDTCLQPVDVAQEMQDQHFD
ncbi:hypothetical protein NFI96_002624 [Prochilodus magdalenae]|nr:hypothetical protein NFI96_002624 [Prochilodus magdalenae]